MTVDAHIHLWGESVAAADWLSSDETADLRRPFSPADYSSQAIPLGIDRAIVVTAEQSERETDRLLRESEESPVVAGVVGWHDLTTDAPIRARAGLVGIRHSVISEDEGWLDRADVRRGVAAFEAGGLVLELLIAARDLPAVVRLAQAHPGLTIVVDHLGTPPDAPGDDRDRWRAGIRDLATCGNVRMKLSGAAHGVESVDAALESFGAERMMFGSDWPVVTLRAGLAEELGRVERLTAHLSSSERAHLFGRTAITTYRLDERGAAP